MMASRGVALIIVAIGVVASVAVYVVRSGHSADRIPAVQTVTAAPIPPIPLPRALAIAAPPRAHRETTPQATVTHPTAQGSTPSSTATAESTSTSTGTSSTTKAPTTKSETPHYGPVVTAPPQ